MSTCDGDKGVGACRDLGESFPGTGKSWCKLDQQEATGWAAELLAGDQAREVRIEIMWALQATLS